MEIYIDTANIDEIREASEWGVISGVTTNPSLLAKEGRDMGEVIGEIESLVSGPISVEVIATDVDGMVREARDLTKLADNIAVKIPMIPEGLKAVHTLSQEGIDCNVTLVFSANQALLAARAGAAYVSPFVGRLDDMGVDGMSMVRDVSEIIFHYELDTRIIAASVRHPRHVTEAALAGAHIATVPYDVLKKMIAHPLTDSGLERFLDDWESLQRCMR